MPATGWTTIAAFILDQILVYQDLNEILGNIEAVKGFPKEAQLGGTPGTLYTNTSYAAVVGARYVEVTGSSAGLVGLTFELRCMARVTSGDTGSIRLYNVTDSSQVVEVTFTNTSLALVKSATFSLTSGSNKQYRADVKAATGGNSSPFEVYGCSLVQR